MPFCFFSKKCQKQTFFKVSRTGHHTGWATLWLKFSKKVKYRFGVFLLGAFCFCCFVDKVSIANLVYSLPADSLSWPNNSNSPECRQQLTGVSPHKDRWALSSGRFNKINSMFYISFVLVCTSNPIQPEVQFCIQFSLSVEMLVQPWQCCNVSSLLLI